MKKNYDPVPQWWFYVLLIVVVGLAILTCEGFGGQLQLPYWGVLLAVVMALLFTLPIGVITATTNQVWYSEYNFLSSCSLCLIIIVKSMCSNQDLMSLLSWLLVSCIPGNLLQIWLSRPMATLV